MSIFERAVREKVRFTTSRGVISAEDLWDLPLTSTKNNPNLDDIARDLHEKVKAEHVSFVNPTAARTKQTADSLKLDIVKRVIQVRLDENRLAAEEAARKNQKNRILELLAEKEDAALKNKSEEELRALLESL